MATFRRRGTSGKLNSAPRSSGHEPELYPKEDAEVWARQIEAAIERSDFPDCWARSRWDQATPMLERYKETITPLKKGGAVGTISFADNRNHPIASLSSTSSPRLW